MLAEDIERIGFLLEDHYPKSWISKPNGVRVNSCEFFDGMVVHMVHNPFFDNHNSIKSPPKFEGVIRINGVVKSNYTNK